MCGVDCVGIGGDYNGVSTLPEGLEDVSKYPNLFAALIEDGWQEDDLAKVANGNILRAFREMEAVRDSLAGDRWDETRMDDDDWDSSETGCMYEVN